jgi:hypothetical protein
MARFYGSMHGNRGHVTRCGTATSGIFSHTRGWDCGIIVRMSVDPRTGRDRMTVYRTGGSNSVGGQKVIYDKVVDHPDHRPLK